MSKARHIIYSSRLVTPSPRDGLMAFLALMERAAGMMKCIPNAIIAGDKMSFSAIGDHPYTVSLATNNTKAYVSWVLLVRGRHEHDVKAAHDYLQTPAAPAPAQPAVEVVDDGAE